MKLILAALPVLLGLALVIVAAVHRAGLSGASYTHSPLIAVELGLVVALGLSLLGTPVAALVLLVRGDWRWALGEALSTGTGLALLIAAFAIDAPTLVAMS